MNFVKKYYLWILFFIFFLIRLPFIDQQFLLHDERDIALTGYFIAHTGKSLSGILLPMSFNDVHVGSPFVVFYYSAFWNLFFPMNSVFLTRLAFVFITSFLLFGVYDLISLITKNKTLSILTSVIFCFSPWVFHASRLAVDVFLGMLFLIYGSIYYLKNRKILAYIFFFLSFYSYQAIRLLVPFFIIYLEFMQSQFHNNFKNIIKKIYIPLVFIILLLSSTVIIDSTVSNKRVQDIIFFQTNIFSSKIDYKRNTSNAPEQIKRYMQNKVTETVDYILTGFVKGQDVSYLFKTGDDSPINGNISSGQFLFPFLLFYYLGLFYLGKKNKREYYFLFGLIFIGLLPALLSSHGVTFSFRSAVSGIGYAFTIACGIYYFQSFLKFLKYRYRVFTLILLIFCFFISIVYFSYNYYFRRQSQVAELFNENERQLSEYLIRHDAKSYNIYHNSPQDIFLTYIFLQDHIKNFSQIQNQVRNNSIFIFNKLSFIQCNQSINYDKLKNSIVSEGCLNKNIYDDFMKNKSIHTIPYKDYSNRIAYFVIE